MNLLVFGVNDQNNSFWSLKNFLNSVSEIEMPWDVYGLQRFRNGIVYFNDSKITCVFVDGADSFSQFIRVHLVEQRRLSRSWWAYDSQMIFEGLLLFLNYFFGLSNFLSFKLFLFVLERVISSDSFHHELDEYESSKHEEKDREFLDRNMFF